MVTFFLATGSPLTADTVRANALAANENLVARGGKVFTVQTSAALDERGARRERNRAAALS